MKEATITQEDLDNLLEWLDADRERAGVLYEQIRRGLVEVFHYKGCVDAEYVADVTINRVSKKVPELKRTYSGDPARYFFGVAKLVHLEYRRQQQEVVQLAAREIATAPPHDPTVELTARCLDECMERLPPETREMILRYYHEQKQAKIDTRKALRQRLNVKANALRVRVYRVREKLERCVRDCVERGAGGVMN